MSSRYSFDGIEFSYEDEPNGMFDSLRLEDFESCPECDYRGVLSLKKQGYICPECETLILPSG